MRLLVPCQAISQKTEEGGENNRDKRYSDFSCDESVKENLVEDDELTA